MSFPSNAAIALDDEQLRRNLHKATTTIRAKRARAVAELPDWDELRDAGAAIKAGALATLPEQLERLEAAVTARGGTVHWARDAAEANATVAAIAVRHGAEELIKVKSITTDEIELNDALAKRGITAHETDLAELVNQLAGDWSSHILVPAIHRNRDEIRALFERTIASGQRLDDDPSALTATARAHLRELFLRVPFAVSGANFAIAETGTTMVVESEGNGRMCTTLPQVLVTVMGIEKVLPSWRDLEVFLQLLPRSSTGERMNPYTSLWSGVRAGDGPQEFHLVLLDNGRTNVLADEVGREALHCIRCSACLNVCPVYSRVGGHAYDSVYPGPIGAILTPQLHRARRRSDAAVGVVAVRRLPRGVPGEDRHPEAARAPARAGHARGARRAPRRAHRDEAGRLGVRDPAALRDGPAAAAPRPRAAGQRGGRALGALARAARAAGPDLPRVVA